MNNKAKKTIDNLLNQFPTELQEKGNFESKNPIGIEIEVKWKYFFPELWDKYLINTKHSDLPKDKQESLNAECDKEELILLPKLNKTVECGIHKGFDKYWEFAFDPVTQVDLLDKQLQILQAHNLIPNGQHSLHITIGNMKANKDAYVLLLLLEMISCDQERIQSGFNKDHPKMSATWARKGYGGLFEKDANELKYGATTAVELRTLAFNNWDDNYLLFKTTATLADIIIDKQNNVVNDKIEQWNHFVEETKNILAIFELPNSNWKKPNLTPEYWNNYITHYNDIKNLLIPAFQNSFPELIEKEKKRLKHY